MDSQENDSFLPQPVTGVGNGYKSLFQSAMPTQILISGSDPVPAKTTFELSVCATTSDMYRALGISADVAASTSFGSFQARVDFVNQVEISAKSVTILVVAEKIDGGESMRTAEFTTPPGKALDLYRHGGDSYVSSISTGGSYIAAFNYATYDETTYQKVEAQANLEFSGWSGGLNAKFLLDIENLGKSTNTTSKFHQMAIGFTAALPTTMDQFVIFVDAFGGLDMDRPAVLDFSTQSYLTLDGCPEDFATINDYMDDWDGAGDIDPRPRLANIVVEVLANEKTIKELIELYDFYGCLAIDPRLSAAPSKCQKILGDIAGWRKTVDRDPTKVGITIPTISPEDLEYPVANYALATSSGGPGQGGQYFADIGLEMIGRHVSLKKLTVRSGDSVDSIHMDYAMALGDNNDNWSIAHGGDGGNDAGSISFGPGDTATLVNPRWWNGDQLVKAITISTPTQSVTLGRQDNPPIGAPWNRVPGTCLVGFAGYAWDYLNRLQAQYVQFLPCDWKSSFTTNAQSTPLLPHARHRRHGFRHHGRKRPVEVTIDAIRFVRMLLEANFIKVIDIFKQKGGWEGWLQVELANYISSTYRTVTMERERSVFPNYPRKMADLTITKLGLEDVQPDSYVIELKTEGEYRNEKDPLYVFDGVKDDIEKIASGQLDKKLRDTTAYAIGVLITNKTAAYFDNYVWDAAYEKPVMHKYGPEVDGKYQLRLVEWKWSNFSDDKDDVAER